MKPICRNIQNGGLYEYLGDNRFKNIVYGQEGSVDVEKAKNVFKFNLEATMILNEYPEVKKLISELNLKIEK